MSDGPESETEMARAVTVPTGALAAALDAVPPVAPTCPHLRGRTTQWCALGQATGEAERALLRIGAVEVVGSGPRDAINGVTITPDIMARARALLAEGDA